MKDQNKIVQQYKKIQDKGNFLEVCKKKEGFSNCKYWFDKNKKVPEKKYDKMLELIEMQLETDKENNERTVKNYEIIKNY